jgi:hypothetical protein
MSEREPKLLISDILEAAEKIKKYTINLSFDSFLKDTKTVDAVIRNFEITGEAARRLPDSLKNPTRAGWCNNNNTFQQVEFFFRLDKFDVCPTMVLHHGSSKE